MKAKTKFKKMFYKLPEKARRELVYRYWDTPTNLSLNVCWIEIRNNTEKGEEILKDLGFKDD